MYTSVTKWPDVTESLSPGVGARNGARASACSGGPPSLRRPRFPRKTRRSRFGMVPNIDHRRPLKQILIDTTTRLALGARVHAERFHNFPGFTARGSQVGAARAGISMRRIFVERSIFRRSAGRPDRGPTLAHPTPPSAVPTLDAHSGQLCTHTPMSTARVPFAL